MAEPKAYRIAPSRSSDLGVSALAAEMMREHLREQQRYTDKRTEREFHEGTAERTKRMSLRPGGAFVYRVYDKYGQILYVGLTKNLFTRMAQHRTSEWWADAAHLEWDEYVKREWAEAAEKAAIRKYKPPWNVMHNNRIDGLKRKAYVRSPGS